MNNQEPQTRPFKDAIDRLFYPIIAFLIMGILGAAGGTWYNSKNSVSREQYYQDIGKIQGDVSALRKENEVLKEAIGRWEDTLAKALERIQVSLDRELSYRLPREK